MTQLGATSVINVRLVPTADLTPRQLKAIRGFLDVAYDGEFTDADWDHALGGMHAIVRDRGGVVAHGSVVPRQFDYEGRRLMAGYVEALATRADRQRRGYASCIMAELERIIRSDYDLGALGAADQAARMYEARGWQVWGGPLHVLTPSGVVATPEEEGSVYVLAAGQHLDRFKPLCCDWRAGDVW
jgi:aminoglycoside 2'-N-acetyltransferase I